MSKEPLRLYPNGGKAQNFSVNVAHQSNTLTRAAQDCRYTLEQLESDYLRKNFSYAHRYDYKVKTLLDNLHKNWSTQSKIDWLTINPANRPRLVKLARNILLDYLDDLIDLETAVLVLQRNFVTRNKVIQLYEEINQGCRPLYPSKHRSDPESLKD